MSELEPQAQRLLEWLVGKLGAVIPGRPETYVSYKDAHDELGLNQLGSTYGQSLEHQGLVTLAEWTVAEGKPGITGIIVDRQKHMPGSGYCKVFGRTEYDFLWWESQIRESLQYDWTPHLSKALPEAPQAFDLSEPALRELITTYRILRDTEIARKVKALHQYACQLCGHSILLPDGTKYAEGHHIRPLGDPHCGPDILANIVCVCPNHHAELDYGARDLKPTELQTVEGHAVDPEYIEYHNNYIYKRTLNRS
jgi:hypothetical protein